MRGAHWRLASRSSDNALPTYLRLLARFAHHPATSDREIYVAALGKLTVPALFAAALEPNIKGLYLAGAIASFQNLVQTEVPAVSVRELCPRLY